MPFPSPQDRPNSGTNPHLLHWQADSLPWGVLNIYRVLKENANFPPTDKLYLRRQRKKKIRIVNMDVNE